MGLLAGIESPDTLRKLSRPELRTVADELRAELIRIGSEVGGHFAGSLATVSSTPRATGSSGTSATRPTATRR
jgi:1-deoxy-D-xylulose-5-phosphate synthase